MRKSVFAVFVMVLGCSMLLGGCGQQGAETSASAEMFTDRDFETGYDKSGCVEIQLGGDTASCSSEKVEISGSVVTVKDEGSYLFTGSLDNGQIVVDAEDTDKPQLVFDNVSVNCDDSAALRIVEADKVFVTQTEGSSNSLANGGEFAADDDANVDGTVFSKQDLTFNGGGTLTVTSSAGHGIVCKDDLVFTGGTYNISSSSHGLDANDSIRTVNAAFTVTAGKDGFHAENSDDAEKGFVYIGGGDFVIKAGDDAVHAETALDVTAGNIEITESYEGLEALNIVVSGGSVDITSSDDGLNAAGGNDSSGEGGRDKMGGGKGGPGEQGGGSSGGAIEISGGELTINASGDGIDSNGSLLISGGMTIVSGPVQGDTAVLDYDSSAEITGGTFIGTGAMQMAQTFSSSEQGVIAVSVSELPADSEIVLADSSGAEIMTHTLDQSAEMILLSSPDMEKGKTYKLSAGDASSEVIAE